MKKFLKLTAFTSIFIATTANAMYCPTCSEGQCAYLADKYGTNYRMVNKGGCNYTVSMKQEPAAALEQLKLVSKENLKKTDLKAKVIQPKVKKANPKVKALSTK